MRFVQGVGYPILCPNFKMQSSELLRMCCIERDQDDCVGSTACGVGLFVGRERIIEDDQRM
jgi:hypothetical protein